MLAIIVAYSGNRVIGHQGTLPWTIPTDLRRFRALTLEQAVVMGRKTFESIPQAYRPLPNRRNVVVSRDADYRSPGAETHSSLSDALDACDHECFVVGGASVYAQALPLVDRVYATHVTGNCAGDAFFPSLDPTEWTCIEESEPKVENGHRFGFRTYDRAN
jgi:dihydrofolate reductase